MAIVILPTPTAHYQNGAVPYGTDVKADLDAIVQDYNGNIQNVNLASNLALADTKLAGITTAGKVNGSAITGLANVPAGAGIVPVSNLGTGSPSSSTHLTGDGAWTAMVSQVGFGAWSTKTNTTIYQAATDGIVVGWGGYSCGINSDASTPPTVARASNHDNAGGGGDYSGICCPIKKGDYWQSAGLSTALFWIPLGS